MYYDYITFDIARSWSFDNDTARNCITFAVDNGSSSHAESRKNNFFILGESTSLEIMEALVHQENSLVSILVKRTQNFTWVYPIILIIVIWLLIEKKSLILKLTIKNLNFPTQCFLGNISNGFSAAESRDESWNGNVYDFSVSYNSIDKSDISNIHKYLKSKNNMK